jgi:hypothetical protein
MESRYQVGDQITVIYEQYGNKEIRYPIVEVRPYPRSQVILYIYQTAPGHLRCVDERHLSTERKVTHAKTGWHN